ncbi:coiled-coil domain-containing protein R3HCC1L isoform X2 [Durio zibethinus]|uniref:Coiled-coil domain-containing protein R3HCC1L isoform X2 n=1 Tax=Durio zibethinus TaxID=66656 RepID=A0A6P5XTK0_DURZI|nr:coiled-coil domain-containing protein R3HCC1L isoform X2 [Durio zibethinus]
MEKGAEANWSEEVEDLVSAGDTQGAISFLENLLSNFQTTSSSSSSSSDDLRLTSVLSELASLYSSVGFSLKSDELLSRASFLKQRAHSSSDAGLAKNDLKEDTLSTPDVSFARKGKPLTHVLFVAKGNLEKLPISGDDGSPPKSSSDDDWEAIADREPNVLLSSECLPGVSNLSLEDSKVEGPKRRGRGTFSYTKGELYSDQLFDVAASKDTENEDVCINSETKTLESKYGTHHVLVLADFSPTTRTTDLEKLFEDFRDRGVVICWVNDTTALAVFRTPSIALEACNHVRCPFTVRILDENDMLLSSISARDLEPPRQRPQTSARTAQRLIAQGMGLKLPSSTFGSRELRNQEEARRNRILTRQKLRDDAWGDD